MALAATNQKWSPIIYIAELGSKLTRWKCQNRLRRYAAPLFLILALVAKSSGEEFKQDAFYACSTSQLVH